MKRILCLLTVCVLLIVSVITASAEGVAKFNINLISENDNEAVITIDFEGGTSFSAIDFDIVVNNDKLKVTSIENGTGLNNFQKQGMVAAMSNPEVVPAKVSAAMIPGYRNVDGKDLFKVTLKKLIKENLTASDVEIRITNCSDGGVPSSPIQVSVTTNIGAGDSNEQTITQEVMTSAQAGIADPEIDVQNTINPDYTGEIGTVGATEEKAESEDEGGMNTTTIIIIVVAAVVVAGGVVAVVVSKKKKSTTEKETDKEEKTEETEESKED